MQSNYWASGAFVKLPGWHSWPPFCFVCVFLWKCEPKVLFLVHSGLPALQWVYSSRVLQRTGLMTNSRDMKRLCQPATRILRPVCVCVCVCLVHFKETDNNAILLACSLRENKTQTCSYMPFNTSRYLSSQHRAHRQDQRHRNTDSTSSVQTKLSLSLSLSLRGSSPWSSAPACQLWSNLVICGRCVCRSEQELHTTL